MYQLVINLSIQQCFFSLFPFSLPLAYYGGAHVAANHKATLP